MESCGPASEERGRIRLFLIADQALLRASLGRILSLEPDFDLVGECAPAPQALEIVTKCSPDVVLLEFDGDSARTEQLLCGAARSGLLGKLFVITASAEARDWARMLRLGASGIFLKADSVERLIPAVRTLAMGEMWIAPQVIRMLAEKYPAEAEHFDGKGLTDREQKVLSGILGGLSNRKIGDSMGLSEGSVKAVVQQLFGKTGVRTRSQLVRIAISLSAHTSGRRSVGEHRAVE